MTTTIDPMWIWIAVGVVVLLAIIAMFARGARRAKSDGLRDKFGSEYNHTVKETGSVSKAERDLAERARESRNWNIVPMSASDAERYRTEWTRMEQHFIDRPTTAVVEADELIGEIMRAKGYPMGDFEQHAKALSVMNPNIVEHYRSGHALIAKGGTATTEDMRQAMLHYRSLFEELLRDRADVESHVPTAVDAPANANDGRPRQFTSVRDDERIGH